jgi:glucose-1-phosphate thymidylyltransferase
MQAAGAGVLTPAQEAAARAGLKALMPITDAGGVERPFLDYVLSRLADAGFRRVVLVVAPDHGDLRRLFEGTRRPTRLDLEFVIQPDALGTADAVRSVEPVVAGQPFVVANADNLYPADLLARLRASGEPALPVFERDELARSSGIPTGRLASFALLDVAPDHVLVDIIEKPGAEAMAAAGPRALVSMNCWRFDGRIFDACRDVARSARGEFELPEAVRLAIARGVRFRALPARGPVLDLSRRDDVVSVSERLAGVEVRL